MRPGERLTATETTEVTGPAGEHDPRNDETPGRIDSGREFRETKTGSSGNYPSRAQGGI